MVDFRTTSKFPDGKLNEHDEGELKMMVAAVPEQKVVLLDFGKPVAWLGLPKGMALGLARMLITRANELPD